MLSTIRDLFGVTGDKGCIGVFLFTYVMPAALQLACADMVSNYEFTYRREILCLKNYVNTGIKDSN